MARKQMTWDARMHASIADSLMGVSYRHADQIASDLIMDGIITCQEFIWYFSLDLDFGFAHYILTSWRTLSSHWSQLMSCKASKIWSHWSRHLPPPIAIISCETSEIMGTARSRQTIASVAMLRTIVLRSDRLPPLLLFKHWICCLPFHCYQLLSGESQYKSCGSVLAFSTTFHWSCLSLACNPSCPHQWACNQMSQDLWGLLCDHNHLLV